jgi:hypothetical protein
MGLDIYFHKTNRSEWEQFENNHSDDFTPKVIGDFRKVNFLMSFFGYEGNCEFKEIGRDKLEELRKVTKEIVRMKPVVHRVKAVILPGGGGLGPAQEEDEYSEADKRRCAEILPTQSGFFFGSTEYDTWYFHDVREVYNWVDEVLDNLADDEVVLMYCWW